MKPTQEQIWNAAVALTTSTKWVTLPGAVLSALTLAEIFERHTAHLEEPKPIPTRTEPTDKEWQTAWKVITYSAGVPLWGFVKRVSAEAYYLAAEREKEKP